MQPQNKLKQDTGETPFPVILIFHGAEVFDAGDAAWLIQILNPEKSLVAGVMARTAAAESGLPVVYDGRRPSEILSEYSEISGILVHRAKNTSSAHRFGSLISSHKKSADLVLIEPGSSRIYIWGDPLPALVAWVSALTGYPVVSGSGLSIDPPGTRSIGGCLPGEPVFINGVIIGYATGQEVVISFQNKEILPISGIELKEHGIEKLMKTGFTDLTTTWCKSGTIRSRPPQRSVPVGNRGRVVVVDHDAAACYGSFHPDICGILTIGDDTSAICGHIGCSRGIPVLGITDGDIDGIIPEGYAKGSVILSAVHERDDDLGVEVAKMVSDGLVYWDEWVDMVIQYLGDRVMVIHRE